MRILVCAVLTVYLVVLFARILLSWFPMQPGTALSTVQRVLYDITEPVLAPVRGLIPPLGGGGMAIDISPIVVFMVIGILRGPVFGC